MSQARCLWGGVASRADNVEVERARKLIQDSCAGYKIAKVLTTEDKIVYTAGTDHVQFVSWSPHQKIAAECQAKEIEGRTIKSCERKGKT